VSETKQPATLDTRERKETLPITRGALESTLAEDVSFINVREIRDWSKESREYRPPILSAATLFGLSLGLLGGFVPALAATDADVNGVWWGIFLFGSILGGVVCLLALLSMVLDSPWVRRKLHRERPTALERLADRMESACEKGLVRAAAAEDALREREEREREGQGV
jgi:hypothetical protein